MTKVFRLIYIFVQHTMQKVFLRELRGYNRKGEAMATGTKIIRGMFGWWEKLVQNVLRVISSGGKK